MKIYKKYTNGFSLLELMLTLVVMVGASIGIYKWFSISSVQAAVQKEQDSVGRMVDKISTSFITFGDYSIVKTETVAGILNVPYNQSTQSIDTNLKYNLQVTPDKFQTDNDSFRLTYKSVDRKTCVALIPALAKRSSGVFVGSNTNIQTKPNQEPDGGVISTQCASANVVDVGFRFSSDKSQFAPVGEMQSGLCMPDTETQVLQCPAGSSGSITQRRTSTCDTTDPENPQTVWSSWVTASNTCGLDSTPIAPIAPIPPVDVCIPQSRMQTANCPAGQVGAVLQQQTFSCTDNTWSAWSTVSNSCRANPVHKDCVPSSRRQTVLCPNNQWGGILQEQASTCNVNGDEVWGTDWKTISTTCTATCVGQGTCCTIIRDADEARSEFCPTGQWGRLTSTWGRTSTCPSSTSTTGAQWGNWIQKTPTQGSCNTCNPRDETETREVPVNVGCPAGQTGNNTYISVQQRTRRGTFNCINGSNATEPTTPDNWTAWSGWTEISRSGETNTCATPPANECAVDGNYTITSQKLVITSGTTSRTVDPYTFGQLEYNSGSTNNMQVRGTVTGVFNGQPFTGTVGASQTPTLRGTGECYAHRGQGPNAYLNSCGGGGMPPGLDLYIFMANNSQAQMSLDSRPCGSGSGSEGIARIPSGNLISYGTYSFIQTNQAVAGQQTLVSLAKIDPPTNNGPLNAEYVNYTITYNDVTLSGLRGSCGPVRLVGNTEICSSEQTLNFGGKYLVVAIQATSSNLPTGKEVYARVFVTPLR